jgi:hypothetical protein
MAEDYVRPPIVGLELPSQRAAIWRFRIFLGVMLAVLILIIVLIARAIVHNTDGTGTVGAAPVPAGSAQLR